ncbi:MAG TPA: peptidylprolyl isomerase [Gemmatimonadaceae bacterium]
MGSTRMIQRHLPMLALLLAAVAPATAAQGIPAAGGTADSTRSVAVADSAGATVAPIDGVVAVVGDQPILHTDVEERLGTLRAQGQQMPTDSAGQARLYKQIIDQLIDEELLVHQAKVEKIEVSDNEISADVDRQLSQIRGRFASDAEFRTQLRGAGFGTPDEYRRWLLDQARRQQLQQKLFDKLRQESKLAPAPVSEAEIDSFFQASKGQIEKMPATVTYRQIVITPKPSAKADSLALAKAESLLAEIRRGGDFAQIAKRESMDPGTKELGGDLGWHRRGEFVPEFDRMYFALPPGQVSPVIKTTYGYHIIKIDRAQPAEVKGRHILIRPEVDSADVSRARLQADSVAALWRKGANYDSLVARYHDAAEEKLMPEPFPKSQLPKEYQTAIGDHKAGDILDPFEIEDKSRGVPKFFVLELTSVSSEREPTLADYRERIRDQIAQQKGIRRYLDNLRKQTFVAVYGG